MAKKRPHSKGNAVRQDGADAFRVITVGASMGGVESLTRLVERLPPNLPAAVLIVLHVSPDGRSFLPEILNRAHRLKAAHARDGEPIRPGRIYIAPPNHHMLVHEGDIRLSRGPHENSARPAIDPLFRTAAKYYGDRVIGVVLSGGLDDGTVGLIDIKAAGGLAVVQDPADAICRSMPESAARHVQVDYLKPLNEIGPLLGRLVREPVAQNGSRNGDGKMASRTTLRASDGKAAGSKAKDEPDIAEFGSNVMATSMSVAPPSPFTCPDCGGVLWEFNSDGVLRYRCHVGHGYTADSLVAAQTQKLEEALWIALRALEEAAGTHRRMAARARGSRMDHIAQSYEEGAATAEQHAALLLNLLLLGSKAPHRINLAEAHAVQKRALRAQDRSVPNGRAPARAQRGEKTRRK